VRCNEEPEVSGKHGGLVALALSMLSVVSAIADDFLERFCFADFLHPESLHFDDGELTSGLLYPSSCASALGLALAFGLFWITPSIAWLNVTNSDTSLAMISAKTRMAVLICAAPPLSANRPESISSRDWLLCGTENAISVALWNGQLNRVWTRSGYLVGRICRVCLP
jgi:hypothetical protein